MAPRFTTLHYVYTSVVDSIMQFHHYLPFPWVGLKQIETIKHHQTISKYGMVQQMAVCQNLVPL